MKKIGLMGLMGLMLCGCALQQTASKIAVNGNEFYLPKDSQFESLQYSYPVVLTNGQVGVFTLVIVNGKFKMDPAVIDKATAHDTGLLNAGGALVLQGAGLIPK